MIYGKQGDLKSAVLPAKKRWRLRYRRRHRDHAGAPILHSSAIDAVCLRAARR